MKPTQQRKINSNGVMINIALLAVCCLMLNVLSQGTSAASEKESLVDRIKTLIAKELKSSVSEDVELIGIRPLNDADLIENSGNYDISGVFMNGYSGKNKVTFSVRLVDKKMHTKSLTVEASYDVTTDVFVTSKPLAKGSTITADDFYPVKQKNSRLSAGVVTDRSELEGKLVKLNISQGIILKADYLTGQMNVKRGQRVNVLIEGNNVIIAAHGVLRADAVVGGVARVFCDSSKKEITGILESSNAVRVRI